MENNSFISFGGALDFTKHGNYRDATLCLFYFCRSRGHHTTSPCAASISHLLQRGSIASSFFHSVWEQEMLTKRRSS